MKIKLQLKEFFYIAAIIGIVVYVWQVVGGYFTNISIMSAFTPLLIGVTIAYIIWPFVSMLERFKLKRWLALIIVYIVLITMTIVLVKAISPVIISNFSDLASSLPGYAIYWIDEFRMLDINIPGVDIDSEISRLFYNLMNVAGDISLSIARNLFGILSNSLTTLLNIFLGILISFYAILDKESILKSVQNLCPKKYRNRTIEYARIFDRALSSYLRGMILVMLELGVLTYICMWALNVRYALILGIVTGLLKVVPIIGAWICFVPIALFALLDGPQKAILASIVYIIAQNIDSYIITPKVMGNQVGVHPILVIVGIFVFQRMFGMIGMILAVPMMGFIKLCYIKLKEQHQGTRVQINQIK